MSTLTNPDTSINVAAVRADKRVNTRGSSGVDAWAIYGEIDAFADGDDEATHTLRFLAAGNALFYQLKEADKRAADWKFVSVPTTEILNRTLDDALREGVPITGDHFVLRGLPIVGQLVATDVESITHKNESPQGRYTFKTTYEKKYGKGV
jgi:hypothetical protein